MSVNYNYTNPDPRTTYDSLGGNVTNPNSSGTYTESSVATLNAISGIPQGTYLITWSTTITRTGSNNPTTVYRFLLNAGIFANNQVLPAVNGNDTVYTFGFCDFYTFTATTTLITLNLFISSGGSGSWTIPSDGAGSLTVMRIA